VDLGYDGEELLGDTFCEVAMSTHLKGAQSGHKVLKGCQLPFMLWKPRSYLLSRSELMKHLSILCASPCRWAGAEVTGSRRERGSDPVNSLGKHPRGCQQRGKIYTYTHSACIFTIPAPTIFLDPTMSWWEVIQRSNPFYVSMPSTMLACSIMIIHRSHLTPVSQNWGGIRHGSGIYH
jgi:hypothetical protein